MSLHLSSQPNFGNRETEVLVTEPLFYAQYTHKYLFEQMHDTCINLQHTTQQPALVFHDYPRQGATSIMCIVMLVFWVVSASFSNILYSLSTASALRQVAVVVFPSLR